MPLKNFLRAFLVWVFIFLLFLDLLTLSPFLFLINDYLFSSFSSSQNLNWKIPFFLFVYCVEEKRNRIIDYCFCRIHKIIYCNISNNLTHHPRAYRHRQLTFSIAITSRKWWRPLIRTTWRHRRPWAKCRRRFRRTMFRTPLKRLTIYDTVPAWCDANCRCSTIIHHQIIHRTHM